jgi:N-acetylglucosaminyl-diphospho-decaprenol L-rhamnosyltransferase
MHLENTDTRLAAEARRARPRPHATTGARRRPAEAVTAEVESAANRGGDAASHAAVDELAVVVVSHNSLAEIDRCLASMVDLGCPVYVVDTASTDGSASHVRETYPGVHVIDTENRGFGAAANEGVRLATSTYVLVLNADAWPEPGALRSLVEAADGEPTMGAIGPRLVYPDGSRQRSIFGFPRNAGALVSLVMFPGVTSRTYELWQALRGHPDRHDGNGDWFEVGSSEFVSGAAMLFRREAFAEVGGFDGRFFMYCEEIDLCLRLRQAGWSVAFHPASVFTHVGGASTQRQPERMYGELVQSYLSFIAKHHGRATAQQARSMALRALAVRSLLPPPGRRRRARAALRRLRSQESRAALESFVGTAP